MNTGYQLLSAKFIRKQAKQLRAQFDGICSAEEIEFVHHARVASRRLRAAMRIFGECFSRKQVKRWKKAIRRICSELGEARDTDVQIEILREVFVSLGDENCFAGVSRLLVEWEYQRERLQNNVVRAVNRLKRDGTLKEVESAAKRLLAKADSHEIRVQSHESFARAEKEILNRLNNLLSLADCLSRPEDRQSHHAMRIAAKRLRYTLEIAGPIYDGRLDCVVDAIKQIQTLLGEVHDCDVWQEKLDLFVKDQCARIKSCYGHAGPFTRLNAGIEHFRQNRLQRRHQCFEDLVRLWGELDVQEVWENLTGIVQSNSEPLQTPEKYPDQQNIVESPGEVKELASDRPDTASKSNGNGDRNQSPALSPPYTPTSGEDIEHRRHPSHRTPVVP